MQCSIVTRENYLACIGRLAMRLVLLSLVVGALGCGSGDPKSADGKANQTGKAGDDKAKPGSKEEEKPCLNWRPRKTWPRSRPE